MVYGGNMKNEARLLKEIAKTFKAHADSIRREWNDEVWASAWDKRAELLETLAKEIRR